MSESKPTKTITFTERDDGTIDAQETERPTRRQCSNCGRVHTPDFQPCMNEA